MQSFGPGEHQVTTATASGVVRIWDIRPGAATPLTLPHSDVVQSVAFDPGGTRLVTAEELRRMIADNEIVDSLTLALFARMTACGILP